MGINPSNKKTVIACLLTAAFILAVIWFFFLRKKSSSEEESGKEEESSEIQESEFRAGSVKDCSGLCGLKHKAGTPAFRQCMIDCTGMSEKDVHCVRECKDKKGFNPRTREFAQCFRNCKS